jgi:hypothetical protein
MASQDEIVNITEDGGIVKKITQAGEGPLPEAGDEIVCE